MVFQPQFLFLQALNGQLRGRPLFMQCMDGLVQIAVLLPQHFQFDAQNVFMVQFLRRIHWYDSDPDAIGPTVPIFARMQSGLVTCPPCQPDDGVIAALPKASEQRPTHKTGPERVELGAHT